jgi:hypothetical protein
MSRIRIVRATVAAALVAALGFGATQAMAAPAPVKDTRIICPFGQQACNCPSGSYCTFTDPCVCG